MESSFSMAEGLSFCTFKSSFPFPCRLKLPVRETSTYQWEGHNIVNLDGRTRSETMEEVSASRNRVRINYPRQACFILIEIRFAICHLPQKTTPLTSRLYFQVEGC